MKKEEVFGVLKSIGAILEGHFVYTSGKHGSIYIGKDVIYPDIQILRDFCLLMAMPFSRSGVEAVVGPAIGGIILSTRVAEMIQIVSPGRKVLGLYAEKSDRGGFVLNRGYNKLAKGKRILVVEDVINTGGSVLKTIETVRESGGDVIGASAICNRGGITAVRLGIERVEALVDVVFEAYDEEDCPLCAKGVPIRTDFGKGAAFLAKKA